MVAQQPHNKIEFIIPVHNLLNRGLDRIVNSVYSLNIQNISVNVNIVDSSCEKESKILLKKLEGLDFIYHKINYLNTFNKPILLNEGMKRTKGNIIFCTDADYIFKNDFAETMIENLEENTFLVKKVMMLTKHDIIDFDKIENWDIPKRSFNQFGKLANGGIQCFHRKWFEYSGGYDERMFGWCGMDNDFVNRFESNKGVIKWVQDSEFFHQWHQIQKGKDNKSLRMMRKNWYIRDNDKSIIRNKT